MTACRRRTRRSAAGSDPRSAGRGARHHPGCSGLGLPRTRRESHADAVSINAAEYRPLAAGFPGRSIHPYYAKLPASSDPSLVLHEHHGQEFVYVLNGQVTLVTMEDGQRVTATLSAGDSCFIDSTVPHGFVGDGLNPYERSSAEIIDIFWCPLGESYLFAGEIAHSEPQRQRDTAVPA